MTAGLSRVSEPVGIDGVVVTAIAEGRVEELGEWDPPGGWRVFALDLGTGDAPRAVEQRDHAVVEDVEERAKRGVVAVVVPLADVLGEVQRHGAVGPEQPEAVHVHVVQVEGLVAGGAGDRGRWERDRGLLPEAGGVLRGA